MEIVLVRHGRPKGARERPMTGSEFTLWLRRYDAGGIDDTPPESLRERLAGVRLITSGLPRAVASAALLEPATPADLLFREPELPVPRAFPPYIRLNPHLWATLLRAAWVLGYSPGVPSFRAVLQRAKQAALALAEGARESGRVAVVGHGVFHALVGMQLRAMGWQGPLLPRLRHWGCATYRRP